MKKTFLTLAASAALLAAMGAATPALAQTSAVNSALLSLQGNQLDKAMASINEAIANDKTKDKAKTWFTRGDIYARLVDPTMTTLTAKYTANLKPAETLQTAADSYSKALQLDGPTGEFGKQVPARLQGLYGVAFNDAVKNFQAKDYDKAAASFKQASLLSPKDTTAVLYTAYALDAKKDYTGSKASYNQLLGMGYKSVPVYSRLIMLAKEDKNAAETKQVVQQALVAYPTNKSFLIEDLNLSMGGGGTEAIDKLSKTIAADPGNANLYAVRGSLYDNQKPAKTDLAEADYKKAIELDPNTFDAQFNLGVHGFNKGIELVNRARKMDMKTYTASGKKVESDGKKMVEAAIPYFEKARMLQPKDAGVLQSLQKAYATVGRTADSDRTRAELDALGKK
ncbi:MAG: tetratricopeptide repeat protein [Janthinobacterium lividum]